MGEPPKTLGMTNMHATILAILGIILAIVGAYIIYTPGAPMRGSGIGTALLVAGVILLIIAFLRFFYKPKK
jgi:uncharacterized membrane protein HdeD (DUF308 family)